MGSAVVKPLTRHRGKMKANEIAVNFSDRKAEANVNSNCEASAGWQRKSLAGAVRRRLPDSRSGGSSETCSSNTHIIHKVCCTNIYMSRRPTPSESMEELYLTQFPRPEYSSSKTLINRDMGQLTLEVSGNTGRAPSPAKMSVSSFTLYPGGSAVMYIVFMFLDVVVVIGDVVVVVVGYASCKWSSSVVYCK